MIAHKVKVVLGIVVAICIAMAIPSFASPQLSDSSVTYSVRGYFSQYVNTFSSLGVSLTRGILHSDGTITDTSSSYFYSSYIPISGGDSFCVIYTGSNVSIGLNNVAYYDSDYNLIPGGYDFQNSGLRQKYFTSPSNASFVRITEVSSQYYTVFGFLTSVFPLTDNNYSYVYHSIDDISISSDGSISIPYQTNAYTSVFLDFEFYGNNSFIDSFSLDVYTYFTGGFFDGRIINEYKAENL